MKRIAFQVGVALLLAAFAYADRPQSGLSFRGSMYSDLGAYHKFRHEAEDSIDFRGITNLGLNFQNENRRYGKVEGSIDFLMPHGIYIQNMFGSIPFTEGTADTLLEFFDKAPLLVDVRKFYLSLFLPFADVTLGRQIINFGKGFLFSPVDVFSNVEVKDLNFRRSGSDIVMVSVPIGTLSGADMVVEIPFLSRTHSSALKIFTTLGGWDLSLIGIYHDAERDKGKDEAMVGGAFKGDLEIGVHGEIAVTLDQTLGNPGFEGMIGVDYSIRDRVSLMAEYLYKQRNLTGSPWGEHNVFGSAQFAINDLMNISGSIIHDFQKSMSIAALQFFYNVLQNADLITYVRVFRGVPLYDAEYAMRVEIKF